MHSKAHVDICVRIQCTITGVVKLQPMSDRGSQILVEGFRERVINEKVANLSRNSIIHCIVFVNLQ